MKDEMNKSECNESKHKLIYQLMFNNKCSF